MSEWFNDLAPVEWFSEQFVDPSAWSIFRLMMLAWVFAAAVLIVLDRINTMLLGRSRPLAQEPPVRARMWRWRNATPPENYSAFPAGTMVPATVPVIASPVPLERPALPSQVDEDEQEEQPENSVLLPDPAMPMDDDDFWRLFANDEAPVFGYENGVRVSNGNPPERYNPITGRVEALLRSEAAGTLSWSWLPDDPNVIGPE